MLPEDGIKTPERQEAPGLCRPLAGALPASPAAARFTAVMEIVFVSGFFSDFLVALAVAGLLGAPAETLTKSPWPLFVLMMASTAAIQAIVAILQRLNADEPRLSIPLRPPRGWWRESGFCLALLPILLGAMIAVRGLFAACLPGATLPSNPLLGMIRTPGELALFLVSGVVAGGIREEVQRAFIVLRGEVVFRAPLTTLAVWSVLFGLSHRIQGWDAAFSTAVIGFLLGVVFLKRRNLYTPMLSHALFNVAVLLLYWFGTRGGQA